jgi:hypothetical protein
MVNSRLFLYPKDCDCRAQNSFCLSCIEWAAIFLYISNRLVLFSVRYENQAEQLFVIFSMLMKKKLS